MIGFTAGAGGGPSTCIVNKTGSNVHYGEAKEGAQVANLQIYHGNRHFAVGIEQSMEQHECAHSDTKYGK